MKVYSVYEKIDFGSEITFLGTFSKMEYAKEYTQDLWKDIDYEVIEDTEEAYHIYSLSVVSDETIWVDSVIIDEKVDKKL